MNKMRYIQPSFFCAWLIRISVNADSESRRPTNEFKQRAPRVLPEMPDRVSQDAEEIDYEIGRQAKVTNFFSPGRRPTCPVSDNPKPGANGDFESFTSDSEAIDQKQPVFFIL